MALKLENESLKKVLETKQGKTYTVFGVTLMTVLFMFMFAVRPAWVSISNKLSENAVKRDYLNQAEQKLSNLDTLSQEYLENQESIEYLNKYYLPETPTESFVVKNFTLMAQENNLEVQFLQVDRPEPYEDNTTGVGISDPSIIAQSKSFITLRGPLDNIYGFVTQLEDMGKIINIVGLNYTTFEEDDQISSEWQITIDAYFYFWDIQDFKLREDV